MKRTLTKQLDCSDFKSDFSQIHHEKPSSKMFSNGLDIEGPNRKLPHKLVNSGCCCMDGAIWTFFFVRTGCFSLDYEQRTALEAFLYA